MTRFYASVLFLATVGISVAQSQSGFTIVRPADGSKIREKIKILFPKGSIPEGGYVGIFINGGFIEATVPPTGAKYIEYALDTKKLKLPDGQATIEAKLYVDFNEKPRVVDSSSIQVEVANQANITIPEEGFLLRYNFRPGTEMVYRWYNQVKRGSITAAQAARGGTMAEMSGEVKSARLLYAIDNKYSDGDGLMRIQPLPNRGRDYFEISTPAAPDGRKYYENEMAAVYMRVSPTGMEKFSSIPSYTPSFGSGSTVTNLDTFFPLPSLPTKRVKPGSDPWVTRFITGDLDLDNKFNADKLTDIIPARGEFLNVEWEAGHPCAKIRHSVAIDPSKGQKMPTNMISLEETLWYALDTRQLIRIERTQVVNAVSQVAPGAGPNRPAGGTGRGRPAGGSTGRPVGGASDFGETNMREPNISLMQGKTGRSSGGNRPPRNPAGNQGGRAPMNQPPANQPPPQPQGTIDRMTIQQTFVLEQ